MRFLFSILSITLLGACIHVHAPKRVVVQCKVNGKVSLVNLENAQLICEFKTLKEERKQ